VDDNTAADALFDFLAARLGTETDRYLTTAADLMEALDLDLAAVRAGLQLLVDSDEFEVTDPVKEHPLDPAHITRGWPILVCTLGLVFDEPGRDVMGEWFDSGWNRLLPPMSHILLMAVGGPNGTGISTTLDETDMAATRADLFGPHGLDSPIDWALDDGTPADFEQRMLDAERRTRWETLITKAGHPAPATVRQLAHFLVDLGVFEHSPATDTGPERWAIVSPIPLVVDTLPVDAEYAAEEARIAADRESFPFSSAIISHVVEDLDGPTGPIPMRVDLLAATVGLTAGQVRAGLAMLVDDGDFAVTNNHDQSVDPAELADTAEFSLTADWDLFDQTRTHISFGN
jgi:hypothetical protein